VKTSGGQSLIPWKKKSNCRQRWSNFDNSKDEFDQYLQRAMTPLHEVLNITQHVMDHPEETMLPAKRKT
jgi:16S rRNA G527 N7-methylase RsmG